MGKETPKRYMLIFEPQYAGCQYVIHSDEVIKIRKYTDIPYGENNKVRKSLLSDIDKATAKLPNLEALFMKYVDPNIFRYNGFNLHKIFIGYKHNGYMKTLDLVINNPEFLTRTSFVEGTKINDYYGKRKLIQFIMDEDSQFMKYINTRVQNHDIGLSSDTLGLMNRMKYYQSIMKTQMYGESEVLYELKALESSLERRFTSYTEYRAMFLLMQQYKEHLANEKKRLEEEKQTLTTKKETPLIGNFEPMKGEQLDLFGNCNPVLKKVPKS